MKSDTPKTDELARDTCPPPQVSLFDRLRQILKTYRISA